MNCIGYVTALLNDSMFHSDESIMAALEGVASDEMTWQHAAYARENCFPGMPEAGTVAWHVVHLAHSARHYAWIISNMPVNEEPMSATPQFEGPGALEATLRTAHEALVEAVSAKSDMDLDSECARGMSLGAFIGMVLRHNAWHAGQIRMLRRLWRHRLETGNAE